MTRTTKSAAKVRSTGARKTTTSASARRSGLDKAALERAAVALRDDTARFLVELGSTPSPSGWCEPAEPLLNAAFASTDMLDAPRRTRKGALLFTARGAVKPSRMVAAHVDTLAAMVKRIKPSGRLELSPVGHYQALCVAGEYCTVHARSGRAITGTIVPERISGHIFKDLSDAVAKFESLEVRLDARTTTADTTKELGIEPGDFVTLDARAQYTEAGFVKSRHLDDKAGVAAVWAALMMLSRIGVKPSRPFGVFISTLEEVGHGGAPSVPAEVEELVVVDMAAVGQGQNSDEFSCSLCLKDASGPYHRPLSDRLIAMATRFGIKLQKDLYVHYSSDGSAALMAGADVAVALIGPGVDASHAYERTHMDSVMETAKLVAAYLASE